MTQVRRHALKLKGLLNSKRFISLEVQAYMSKEDESHKHGDISGVVNPDIFVLSSHLWIFIDIPKFKNVGSSSSVLRIMSLH